MPDWKTLIAERLKSLNLPQTTREEVVLELAAHLEDVYEEQLAAGSGAAQAQESALNQICNWRSLAKSIERAKRKEGILNNRSKQFWLPALLSLAASMIWMMALQIASTKLQMPWKHAGLAYWPYVVWVITLPLIGRVCGHLSSRAGSKLPARITAVIFPSIVMSVVWLVLGVVLIARKNPHLFQTLNFAYGFLLWVIVPAVALWAGTLPVTKTDRLRTR